jgi:DNA-binding MarR family transcriptional regulator
MSRQPTQKEKTERAFRAYLDLLDAEERVKAELRGPLELVGLTVEGFRLMETLDREGALPLADVARTRGRDREATYDVIARLEKHGWVRRAFVKLPPVEFKLAHLPRSMKDEPREGRRMTVVGLTAPGKKFIGDVLRRYSKVVKSIMRGINSREQESLSRICRKLREGDVMKFVAEITHEDVED